MASVLEPPSKEGVLGARAASRNFNSTYAHPGQMGIWQMKGAVA